MLLTRWLQLRHRSREMDRGPRTASRRRMRRASCAGFRSWSEAAAPPAGDPAVPSLAGAYPPPAPSSRFPTHSSESSALADAAGERRRPRGRELAAALASSRRPTAASLAAAVIHARAAGAFASLDACAHGRCPAGVPRRVGAVGVLAARAGVDGATARRAALDFAKASVVVPCSDGGLRTAGDPSSVASVCGVTCPGCGDRGDEGRAAAAELDMARLLPGRAVAVGETF